MQIFNKIEDYIIHFKEAFLLRRLEMNPTGQDCDRKKLLGTLIRSTDVLWTRPDEGATVHLVGHHDERWLIVLVDEDALIIWDGNRNKLLNTSFQKGVEDERDTGTRGDA